VLFRDPPPASSLIRGLPASIDRVLAKALAKRPADRHPDAHAFAVDLEAILAGRSPSAAAHPSPQATLVSKSVTPDPPGALPALPLPLGATPSALAAAVHRIVSWIRRWPEWKTDRRGVVGRVAALVILALASGMALSGWGRASVELNLEHSLRSGVVKVFVDDRLVLEEELESWVKDDLVIVKVRKGRLNQTFRVPAGECILRLEVEGDGFRGSRSIDGRFAAGEVRRLEARVGGLVKKDLSLWLAPAKES
jgi:hypothetical protein